MWLCNAYKFRLHKWIMYTVYTKENRFGVKMTAFLFFSYSLHAKRIKKVMKRKKLIFKTICFYTII